MSVDAMSLRGALGAFEGAADLIESLQPLILLGVDEGTPDDRARVEQVASRVVVALGPVFARFVHAPLSEQEDVPGYTEVPQEEAKDALVESQSVLQEELDSTETTLETPVQTPEPGDEPPAGEETSPKEEIDRESLILDAIEKHARQRGAFSADDLRANPDVSELLNDEEYRTLGRRLAAIRKQLLARLEEQGERAMWVKQGSKYVLAFWAQPEAARADEVTEKEDPITLMEDTVVAIQEQAPVAAPEPGAEQTVGGVDISRLVQKFKPESPSAETLSEQQLEQMRKAALAILLQGNEGRISASTMIDVAAQQWGVSPNVAAQILQQLYQNRMIGKKDVGTEVCYSANPEERRRARRANGEQTGGPRRETSKDRIKREKKELYDQWALPVINVLLDKLTHVQQKLTPAEVRGHILETSDDTSLAISEDGVKTLGRMLDSMGYVGCGRVPITNRGPLSRSRGQEVLKLWIKNQSVKLARKNHRRTFETAIAEGKTFSELEELLQDAD